MLRLPNTVRGILLFLITTSSLSCKKIIEYIDNHHPKPDPSEYRIKKITVPDTFFGDHVYTFQYNERKDPVRVDVSNLETSTVLFRYDEQHRLSDYIKANDKGRYYLWYRYGYDGNSRQPARDTIFQSGNGVIADNPDPAANAFLGVVVRKIYYDQHMRVIADSARYIIEPAEPEYYQDFTSNYTYDTEGNLVINPANNPEYDNKLSLYRTNDIWMFVHRNYSRNNPSAAQSYNSIGLPTAFDNNDNYLSFLVWSLRTATIEYEQVD
jgi:hypothetical protein